MSVKSMARTNLPIFHSIYSLMMTLFIILAACSGSSDAPQISQDSSPDFAMYMSGVLEGPEKWQNEDCPTSCPANENAPCPANCPEGSPDKCKAKVYPRAEKIKHAEKIASSGLTTIIYMFLHFYPDGSLVLNSTPLVYADGTINLDIAYLKDLFKVMKAGGQKKVLLSIGGWHTSDYTFSRILTSLSVYPNPETNPYFRNLLIAKQYFQFDGIDLDFEPDWEVGFIAYDDTYAKLLADITRWAYANGMIVTCAPYTEIDFWKKVLAKTVGADGRQMVTRFNVQFYGGGSNNAYQEWFDGLTDPNNGIADLDRFLSVGYDCTKSPDDVQKNLASIKNGAWYKGKSYDHPNFNSGFIYQYQNIVSCECNSYTFESYVGALTYASAVGKPHCSDKTLRCMKNKGTGSKAGEVMMGQCWYWFPPGCDDCPHTNYAKYTAECNENFAAECKDNCYACDTKYSGGSGLLTCYDHNGKGNVVGVQ
jgi:hypothetical protein